MPITNNASYVPTMNEFLAHWAAVDAALGAAMLVPTKPGATIDRVNFTNLRMALLGNLNGVIDALNDLEITRAAINLLKTPLLERLREFTQLANTYYQGTHFAPAVPKVPSLTDGQETFLAPMRDMVSLWKKMNAGDAPAGISLPLTLADGTLCAEVEAKVVELDAAYLEAASAAQSVTMARSKRDATKDQAYLVMKNYRQAVPSRCKQHPALVSSLPALTPTGGHTPEPVNASAVFQAPDQAKVAYSASTDAELARYELRGNPGDAYNEDDAVTVETRNPEEVREFLTNFGLNQPGAEVSFKVFVVLTTGNEAGSAALVVRRPPV